MLLERDNLQDLQERATRGEQRARTLFKNEQNPLLPDTLLLPARSVNRQKWNISKYC